MKGKDGCGSDGNGGGKKKRRFRPRWYVTAWALAAWLILAGGLTYGPLLQVGPGPVRFDFSDPDWPKKLGVMAIGMAFLFLGCWLYDRAVKDPGNGDDGDENRK